MTIKHAYFIRSVDEKFETVLLNSVAVPVELNEAAKVKDAYFVNGDYNNEINVEELTTTIPLCTGERVSEDALGLSQLMLNSSAGREKLPNCPFWLLPCTRLYPASTEVRFYNHIRNYFQLSNFQAECWSRFIWGNIFFENPTTPVQHSKIAIEKVIEQGDALSVITEAGVNGIVCINNRVSENAFDSTFFFIHNKYNSVDISNTDLYSYCKIDIENMTSIFKTHIGHIQIK